MSPIVALVSMRRCRRGSWGDARVEKFQSVFHVVVFVCEFLLVFVEIPPCCRNSVVDFLLACVVEC